MLSRNASIPCSWEDDGWKRTLKNQEACGEWPWQRPLPCSYAVIASRRYFPGLIVLLHSLVHQNAAEPDCGGLIVMWHPSFEETVLSETQRDELKCIAGARRIEFLRVDDSRAAVWRRVPTRCNCSEASSSLLKLETFYLERRNHAVLFLDSDMLVMKPLNRIAMSMSYRALHNPIFNSTDPIYGWKKTWKLHGSAARGAAGTQPSAIQLGFHAFVMPSPVDVSAEMIQVCLSLIEGNRIKENLDQDVVKLALHRLGMRYEPKRYNRTKSWRNRPRQLFLHPEWHTNYFPSSKQDLTIKRALHWGGHPKPWTCPGKRRAQTYFATNGKGRSQVFYGSLRELWQAACNRTVGGGCVGSWLAPVCTPSCGSGAVGR